MSFTVNGVVLSTPGIERTWKDLITRGSISTTPRVVASAADLKELVAKGLVNITQKKDRCIVTPK